MKHIFSSVAPQSTWRRWLAVVMVGALPLMSQATLIFDVGDHIISAANPTITLSLENTGASPLLLLGADVLFEIQSGGPTVSTSTVDPLLWSLQLTSDTGFLFGADPGYSQGPGTPFGSQKQAWVVFDFFSGTATIDAGQTATLGTLSFVSFPEGGPYTLNFAGTTFVGSGGGAITDYSLINGSLTVVPEPVPVALGIVGGVFALGQLARIRRRLTPDKPAANP